MIKVPFKILFVGVLIILITACKNKTATEDQVIISVKKEHFLSSGLVEPISIVSRELSDGSTADCYKIVTTATPTDHNMGPWCPSNISDDAKAGGIWINDGKIYDVDGEFIKNLATFYDDDTWMMYDSETGKVIKTSSKEECNDAANPTVGEEYQNFCVECLPTYIGEITHTYYIPVTPKKAEKIYAFTNGHGGPPPGGRPDGDNERPGPPPGGGPDGHDRPDNRSTMPSDRGLAFNGVIFNAPAPVDNILSAYTIAPFDDAGGHINLNAGYHYHAATGVSKKIEQSDNHSAMIGYAFDGYGIFENTDASGKEYTDLDDARGHYDEIRGYHYHVANAGENNFIDGLRGEYAL